MKLALMIDAPNAIPGDSYVKVPTGPYKETLALAAEMGFDGVEILIDHPDTNEFGALQEAAARTGMEVAAINSGRLYFDHGLGLVSEDADVREASRAALLALAHQTALFKVPINIGVFRGLPAPENRADAASQLMTILQETADKVADIGVTLVLEPGNKFEFPFIYSTADGIALVEQAGRPNIALMLDTFHLSMENESLPNAFEVAMPLLRHIHFLDRQRNPPSNQSEDFDFIGVLQMLQRHNYQHFISMPLLQDGDITKTADRIAALRTAITNIENTEKEND
ncbi:MAG: sugar phosphate isomerase/epimerase family protein [Candidatus Promineifilaceae bacterium]